MPEKTTLDLLRHGEPRGGHRYRGQIDDPLSERGWQQMWHAASGDTPWQRIIASPLRRCSEFAQQLSERLAIPLEYDERLVEVGFGSWEGHTSSELRAQLAEKMRHFYHDPVYHRPDGAEPLEGFSRRVNAAVTETLEQHPGKHLLIVAHAGVIRAVIARTLRAPLFAMYRMSIPTASISRIQITAERPPTVMFQGRRKL
ncbi:histidine phosphatase family protein [Candidatus Endoriftia persephonae]|jgi:alpha-ribazole phosphatase/probable phosphoglycerate mutase|uniref:Alpha-ribazole phosphatase n=2 Tax=Gammaproteobacteria TaxID=1236 RepID=G2FAZ2_9GAMM|nr:histidine phosphatase family protein [Candidatus Endoriftia persephone]EGW55930.1 alpha-ribazole phosphatase [endosymbiont of Tevnia jerichonana (vent Tica)]USF88066.1 histidine phosphatase family protein [Candidatus Endoriftia persephone]